MPTHLSSDGWVRQNQDGLWEVTGSSKFPDGHTFAHQPLEHCFWSRQEYDVMM